MPLVGKNSHYREGEDYQMYAKETQDCEPALEHLLAYCKLSLRNQVDQNCELDYCQCNAQSVFGILHQDQQNRYQEEVEFY